jgi:hypothetical protein
MSSFNFTEIYAEFGKEFFDLKTIFFKSKTNTNKLIVIFSAMNTVVEFDRIGTFYNNPSMEEYNILFLQDKEYTYFLGTSEKPLYHSYRKIIEYFMNKILATKETTLTFGSSMGGYAAIYYAFKMNLSGAITGVPQVNKKYAKMHSYQNWIKSINKTGELWEELDEILYNVELELPKLYIEYGKYPADEFAAESLSKVYSDREGMIIKNKGNIKDHKYFVNSSMIKNICELLLNSPKTPEM